MRRLLKVVAWLVAGVVVLALIAVGVFFAVFPKKSDPPAVEVEATPARLARGEYLFHAVTQCGFCHGKTDRSWRYGLVQPTSVGAGGNPFPLGEAGIVYARNITPTALGEWTDGELIRALRDGVSRDGTPLFPIMPYNNYRHMSQEDLYALVAYVRTLRPVPDRAPPRELAFPMSLIIRMMPSPAAWPPPPRAPARADTVAYGQYVFTLASCGECHTPRDRGEPLPGLELSGGMEFLEDDWIVRSANISPDSLTGIGRWTRDDFVARFKGMSIHRRSPVRRGPDEPISPMPWITYGDMTEEDLGVIYDYLRTVTPVERRIERFERSPAGS